jgi:hypothetical protein
MFLLPEQEGGIKLTSWRGSYIRRELIADHNYASRADWREPV